MSQSDILHFFTTIAVQELLSAIQDCQDSDEWIGIAESITHHPDSLLGLEWEFGSPPPTLGHDDAENAIAIYRYLGALTPVAAADRRLWSYLSMVTFRDYTERRWPLVDPKNSKVKWQSRVPDRWILPRNSREALVRNTISRLWWAAALSHDPDCMRSLSQERQDPYAYVRVLLHHEDRFTQITERDPGMIPEVLFALLDHVNSEERYSPTKHIRELMKEVTLVAGYRELAGLHPIQIRSMVENIGHRLMPSAVAA